MFVSPFFGQFYPAFLFRVTFALLLIAIFTGLPAIGWAATSSLPDHSLFVDHDGKLWAWGDNSFGQLGKEGLDAARLPLPVDISVPIKTFAAGRQHSVALDIHGSVWVWGDNSAGQLGTGDFKSLTKPARLELSSVVSVAAGAWHTVALDKTGQVWAWGGNTLGQLGSGKSGKFSVSATPQKIEDLDNVVAISSGDYHVLALRADGSVWAWGGNEQGQLGDGKLAPRDRPYPVAGLEKIRLISSSNNASQAEGINGQVWAWGGRLGANEPWLTPRMLEGGLPIENATAFSISGRVTADGKPVAGATVSVDVDACGKTDTYGSYRCLLPAGFEGLLQAQKDGFVFTPGKISAVSSPLTGQNIHGNAKVAKSLPGLAMELKALKQNTITPPVAAPKAIPTLHLDESEQIREKDAIRLPPTPITEVHPKIAAPAPEARPRTVETSILKKEEPQAVIWHIGGAVHLSGFGAEGQPIVGVEISGQGAQCGKTDSGGEYVCAVPSGWTGHLAATKRNYRFSPSTLSFRDVREDHPFQDFKAVFEPD